MAAQKVAKAGIKRQKGFLYYLDKQGDVSKARMARGGRKGGNPTKVARLRVKRQDGYLYFIDRRGDVSRVRMARGGRRRKSRR